MTKKAFDKIAEGLNEILARDDSDAAFEAEAAALLTHLELFIEKNYGERCPAHEDGCPICELWALRDRFKERVG